MDAFEKALARAQDTLGTSEIQIRHALEKLDLDTSPLTALREAQNWIGSKRPELRRRNETIQAVRETWSPGSAPAPGLTPFDEGLYTRAGHNPDAYAAAHALNQAAENGKLDENTLAQLEKRTDDADFATALMYALGATQFRDLLKKSTDLRDQANAQRLQAALGKALGTASPRLTHHWRAELTADLTGGRHYALSRALIHGKFDAAFLLDIARKIEAHDRKPWQPGEEFFPGAFQDSLVGVLTALSRHPEAAQDFFAQDPAILKRLMTDRATADQGKALSAALLAATTTFRDHAGSPENPSRGYLSAKLTSELIDQAAKRINEGKPLRVTPNALSRIFASYIADLNRVAKPGSDKVSGVYTDNHPILPGVQYWGARFPDETTLRAVLRHVIKEDREAFTLLLGAQTIWANRLLDASAARLAAEKDRSYFSSAAQEIGAGFGLITDAAGLARIKEGEELDQEQERNIKILTALINTGLSIPQHAGWPIVAGTVGAWTGIVEDALKGGAKEKAITAANAQVTDTNFLVHQLAAQAMLNHGLFGPSDPPGKNHPWGSLSNLQPGDDPRNAVNNFLRNDGRTLLTPEEILVRKDAGGNPLAWDAYRRWLYDGPAGELWARVRTDLDSSFNKGFSKYG